MIGTISLATSLFFSLLAVMAYGYAMQVKAEQEELKLQFSMAAFGTSVARLCPYCEHKIEILYRGEHGPSRAKCPNCGEEVVFPPIAFRLYTA